VTWLSLRQLRAQLGAALAAIGALLVALAITGPGLADLPATAGSDFLRQLGGTETTFYYLGFAAVIAAPALIGIFWGAPLVARELEAGTHRLAWAQSVTRSRWLATRLVVTGLLALAAVALLSFAVTWWCQPIDSAINAGHPGLGPLGISRLRPPIFDGRGLAPLGYTAFALSLGVAAGIFTRRTIPAMALTLAVFAAVQIAFPIWVRPSLGPAELTTPITRSNLQGMLITGPASANVSSASKGTVPGKLDIDLGKPGAWVTSSETVDRDGQAVDRLPGWIQTCGPESGPHGGLTGAPECYRRLTALGYEQRITYFPSDRYWSLQGIETAIYAALSLLLVGFSFWRLRRLS
jgi:ABC-2 family transporter protein